MMNIIRKLLAFALAAFTFHAVAVESTGPATSATFTSLSFSASVLANPGRGYAGWSGGEFVTSYDGASVTGGKNNGERLSFCIMNLGAYRGTSISGSYLTSLQNSLNNIRTAGMKCVMQMAYDYSDAGNDDTAANILVHINQLKPYFQNNADVIAYAKAGFIGSYGEWWGSQHANSCGFSSGSTTCATANANRLLIRNALLAAFDKRTVVQFRYPDDVVQWFPTPLSSLQAFNGSAQSRIGFFNDCMLSGQNDTGTFGNNSSGVSAAAQMTYMDTLTKSAAYGGELANGCSAPLRVTCAEARTDFSRWHISWLKNSQATQSSWNSAWASGGCTNEITNLLGYRIQLDKITHQGSATAGQSITANVDLRNVGWSRPMTAYKVQLVLVKTGQTSIVCTSRVDLRAVPSQGTSSFTVSIPCVIPGGTATGTWTPYIRIPDPSPSIASRADYAVQPANATGPWDGTNSRYATGTSLTVN